MVKQAVTELIKATGHKLCLDDFDEIHTLNELGWRIDRPEEQSEKDLLNLPILIGKDVLFQPSLGKIKWYEEGPLKWWPDSDLVTMALGYACSQANSEDFLQTLSDEKTARKKIEKWHRRLKCTAEDFSIALARVMPRGDGGGNDDDPNLYGPTIALLAREYGQSAAYWMYEAPIQLCQAMLADYQAGVEAAYQQHKKAAGVGGPQVAPPATPKMHAQKKFRLMRNALGERWAKEAA